MLHIHLVQVLAAFGAGLVIVLLAMLISGLLRPRRPSFDKLTTYECGEEPIGPGQFRLNFRFYTTALLFIIFDVEVVALLPTVVVFRDWESAGAGSYALAGIFAFVGILAVGLIYEWRKGTMDWLKDIPEEETPR